MEEPLRRGARVSFDTHCRVLLVSTIEADGSSGASIALRCDPADPESFGELAIPLPVAGMYQQPTTWH